MRYATFSLPGDSTPRLGIVRDAHLIDLQELGEVPRTMLELIMQGPEGWRSMVSHIETTLPRYLGMRYALNAVRWHAPIPRPAKNVFCVGRNYISHIQEGARARGQEAKIPEVPVFFTKAPTSITGPFDTITYETSITSEVDWEAELGVIIGLRGRDISRLDAFNHVFGYTVINDVTARDLQKSHFQFFKGKSLDTFCPMGPVVITRDEFGDPQQKAVTLNVNGVRKQTGNTRDMIFSVDAIIEWLSRGMTLEPGDIIATGTPEGVGFGRTPPEFLRDGDVMETEVECIGTLRNVVSVRA